MKKTYLFLFFTFLFVLLLVLLTFFYKNMEKKYKEPKNTSVSTDSSTLPSASDFTFYDINGKQVDLSDFYGSPIVLNFWASWCGPCKSEMKYFDDAYKSLESSGNEKNIQILMVNLTDGERETTKTASDYVSQMGYTFPLYFDSDLDGSSTYNIMYLPTTYFINSDQTILSSESGAIDMDTLEENIQLLK